MKFIIKWTTPKTTCTQCQNRIQEERYAQQKQNRYAKARLCVKCLAELIEGITTGKEIDYSNKKEIVYENISINKNSWMY